MSLERDSAGWEQIRPDGRLRARLLAAAYEVMTRNGVDAAGVAEVAAAGGLPLTAVYDAFASFQALVDALGTELALAGGAAITRSASELEDPAAVVAATVRHSVAVIDQDPVAAWLAVNNGPFAETFEASLGAHLLRTLSRGVWAGRFQATSVLVQHCAVQGALLSVLRERPSGRLPANAGSELAAGLLRLLGLAADEADVIARGPLPPLDRPRPGPRAPAATARARRARRPTRAAFLCGG